MLRVYESMSGVLRRPGAAVLAVAASVVGLAIGGCGGGAAPSDGSGSQGTAGTPASGAAATAPKTSSGTLTVGQPNEVTNLDPDRDEGTAVNWQLWQTVYNTLVTTGDDLSVQPSLATSWKERSPTRYVFDIRRGVRFSNGRAMTVDDVIGSLQRTVSPKHVNTWQGQLGQIRSISASGPWQVTIRLKKPNAALLPALANPIASVLPMKELNAGTFDPTKETLGTGPFKVVAHSQNESWTFAANPYYWQPGIPKMSKFVEKIIPDDSARIAALRNGTVDVAYFDNPDTAALLKGAPNVKTATLNTTDYYRVDVSNRPGALFNDPRLRRALQLVVDRQQINAQALAGAAQPSAAIAPAFKVCNPTRMPFSKPDMEQAKQLVSEAGATGKPVEIVANTGFSTFSPIAQVIQRNLNSIGLKAKVVTMDTGNWLAKSLTPGKFDLSMSYFIGYSDPAMVLLWWNPALAGGWNKAWLPPDRSLNDLITKVQTTDPGPQRSAAIQEACNRIAQNGQIIPLATKNAFLAYRSDLVKPKIQRVEAYGLPWRNVALYELTS